MWYDRPCIENDVSDEPGHKFMCECNVPDKQTGMENPNPQNCQDNNKEIDIASIGERNTVICQNPRPTNNPNKNENIGTPTGTTKIQGVICQDNNEDIDIASIGERTTTICQNGQNDRNEQPPPPPPPNPINNGNIGPIIISRGKNTQIKYLFPD